MSSETFSELNKNTPKSEKLKTNTLLLLMNGAYEKNMVVDVCDVASILQAVGFKLEKLSKTNNNESDNKDANELKITLNCGRSGLQAVYTKNDYVCNCLEDLEIDDNDIKTEFSTRLTGRPLTGIKELLASLANVTNDEDFQTPMCPKNPELQKSNQTAIDWEVDPKTSPPVMTSSPVQDSKIETCAFCLEKDQKITEIIEEIKKQVAQNAEKILDILPKKNNTFTKKQFKRVSDIAKPQITPQMPKMNESYDIKSTVKRMTPKKSPRKILLESPKNRIVQKSSTKTPNENRKLISPKRGLQKHFYSPKTGSIMFTNYIPRSPQSPISDRRNSIGATPMFKPANTKILQSPQLAFKNQLFKSPIIERRNSIGTPIFKPVKVLPKTLLRSPQITVKTQNDSPQGSFRERSSSVGSTKVIKSIPSTNFLKPTSRKSPKPQLKISVQRNSPFGTFNKPELTRKIPLSTLGTHLRPGTVVKEKRTTPTSSSTQIGRPNKDEPKSSEKIQNLVRGSVVATKKRAIPTFRKVESKLK